MKPRRIGVHQRQCRRRLVVHGRKVRIVDVDGQQLEAVSARLLENLGRRHVRVHVRVELAYARKVAASIMENGLASCCSTASQPHSTPEPRAVAGRARCTCVGRLYTAAYFEH